MEKSFEIVSTMYGNFLINEFDYIGEHIKRRENWEPHLYEFYSQILTKDDVCVDAGANLGYHAIQFGNLSKRVYAFEPQPMVFNQLCANILFNDLNDVIIPNRLGLGEEPTTKQMWAIENEKFENGVWNWGGRGIEHEQSAYTSDEVREHDQIKIVPLDLFNIEHCNLLKMDIQGYEWYALQGAKQFLSNKPVILLENNPKINELGRKVLFMLQDLGYEGFRYHMESGEDMILVHPESNKYEISLKTINQLQNKYPIKNEDISSYRI
jgi:FkbM family methyltransferase